MAENELMALLRDVEKVKAEDILDGEKQYLYNIKLWDANGQSNTTGDDINAIPESTSGGTEGDKGQTAAKDLLIHGEIARGGFGIVYKMTIRDGKSETEACLKQSRYCDYDDIIHENEIFSRLTNPLNEYIIARMLACKGIMTNGYYLGLKYFNGETLARIIAICIEERRQISHKDLVLVLQQQIEAIDYLQRHPIYHGDITPNNIMYDSVSQKSKLIDFGLAVCPGMLGDVMKCKGGTVEYKAPEMLIDSKVGDRSDLYGLAATLHHLITQMSPWSSLNEVSTIKAEFPFNLLQTDDYRHKIETCVKAEINRYREMAASSHGQISEMVIQAELLTNARFCDQSIVNLLHEMLSYKPGDRPKCGEISDRIPDKDVAPSISADSRAETSSEDVDGLGSESYYAVAQQPDSSITYSEGVSGIATENFTASTNSELTLRVGQRIRHIVQQTGGYSRGRIGNQSGTFPTNFVELNISDQM